MDFPTYCLALDLAVEHGEVEKSFPRYRVHIHMVHHEPSPKHPSILVISSPSLAPRYHTPGVGIADGKVEKVCSTL